jgi:hypothetical protein
MPRGGKTPVGKLLCAAPVVYLYDEEDNQPKKREVRPVKAPITGAEAVQSSLPGFRFKRLPKAINWLKIRYIDIEK